MQTYVVSICLPLHVYTARCETGILLVHVSFNYVSNCLCFCLQAFVIKYDYIATKVAHVTFLIQTYTDILPALMSACLCMSHSSFY